MMRGVTKDEVGVWKRKMKILFGKRR